MGHAALAQEFSGLGHLLQLDILLIFWQFCLPILGIDALLRFTQAEHETQMHISCVHSAHFDQSGQLCTHAVHHMLRPALKILCAMSCVKP
jgi:hypothetical protein